jgi:hypothetical protein
LYSFEEVSQGILNSTAGQVMNEDRMRTKPNGNAETMAECRVGNSSMLAGDAEQDSAPQVAKG